jgi:RNA polymerase sigma-70 factor (ECF subfamily)
MENESNQLVEKYLAGDEGALERLVHLHTNPLYNFVFLILRDRDGAEDVVQETFLKVWKNLVRFDQKQKFKTWLYTIAKNTAFDFLKKEKALPFSSFETVDREGSFECVADEHSGILETLIQEEEVMRLEEALVKMPETYRALLILVYREDFTLHEAATVLGEPYNTVKSRHQRGIQKLKGLLVGELASEEKSLAYKS